MPTVESQPSTNTDFARPTLMRRGKVHNLEVERILIAPIARGTNRFAEIAAEFLFAGEIVGEIALGVEAVDGVRYAVRAKDGRALHEMKMQMGSRAIPSVA